MKIDYWLECIECSEKYSTDKIRYTCNCGGLLEVKRNLKNVDSKELLALWENRWGEKRSVYASGVWRYKEMILDIP